MQVVWMARMEKVTEADGTYTGLLSSGEADGKWLVLWEPDASVAGNLESSSSVWYEGVSWQEMRAALCSGMAKLLREGYQPSLGFMPDTNLHERRMKERNEWIACYADLHTNDKLYEQLAQWRRETAGSLRRAPYWIATNRMLRLVSVFVPQDADELRQLPGFGEAKVASYADAITAITRAEERKTHFPLDWVERAVPESSFVQWVYEQEQSKMDTELNRLILRRMLLEGVREGMNAQALMEYLQVDRRELLMRIETLAAEGYDMQPYILQELEERTEEEQAAIRGAIMELGSEYLKPIFIRVYGEEAANASGSELQLRYEAIRLIRMTMEQNPDIKDKSNARHRGSKQQNAS